MSKRETRPKLPARSHVPPDDDWNSMGNEAEPMVSWGEHSNVEDRVNAPMILRDGPPNGSEQHPFDLEERTAIFGENVIRLARKIPQNAVTDRVIRQLVGAGTSVGANYCEANESVSKKDFKCRIGTCRKEAKETKFFLRMLATAHDPARDEARKLWLEARELHLIFCAMHRK